MFLIQLEILGTFTLAYRVYFGDPDLSPDCHTELFNNPHLPNLDRTASCACPFHQLVGHRWEFSAFLFAIVVLASLSRKTTSTIPSRLIA